jgi:hypothetical protein
LTLNSPSLLLKTGSKKSQFAWAVAKNNSALALKSFTDFLSVQSIPAILRPSSSFTKSEISDQVEKP